MKITLGNSLVTKICFNTLNLLINHFHNYEDIAY